MKTMKKVFATLLAVVMVMSLSVTAFAAEITVNGVAGQTYTAYKVFDVTKSTAPTSYKEDTAGTYYHYTGTDTTVAEYTETEPTAGLPDYETYTDGSYKKYSAVYSYSYSISASDTAWLPVVLKYMGYTYDETNSVWKNADGNEASSPFTGKGLTLTLSADGSVYDVEATTGDTDTTQVPSFPAPAASAPPSSMWLVLSSSLARLSC